MRRVAPLALAALFAAACAPEQRAASAAHGADTTGINELAPPPPRTLSHFDVPLDYDFTPVLDVVERVVPRTFGSLDSVRTVGDDQRKHYAFVARRGKFTTFVRGSDVHLRTTLSYEARGYYKPLIGPTIGAGCGNRDTQPRIVIELVTPLTLTSNWHLHAATQIARLAPASDSAQDHCTVSILSYDITQRVVDAARKGLTEHLVDIDGKISAIDLTERASGWWKSLDEPFKLADGVWLMLNPQQFRLGRVVGDGHTLLVQAGLDAYPAIITGRVSRAPPPPLPPLAKDTADSGFDIGLEGAVDYLTATRAVTDALRGKVVTEAGRSLTVQSVSVLPATGGRLALAVTFTGDAKGTLRLVGTPKYAAATHMIVVPDLDYDLTTDNQLINAYAWLRSDVLLTLLREKASVPVAPVIDRGRALLLNGLNRTIGGVLTIKAVVDSVSVRGLYVTKPGLIVRARASGSARVIVRQKR